MDNNAKVEMRKALPLILELMDNPTFLKHVKETGLKFDTKEVLRLFADVSGFKMSSGIVVTNGD